jgi:hypothetical protein
MCTIHVYIDVYGSVCILPYMVYTAIHGVYCHTWCILPYMQMYTYAAIHAPVYSVYDVMCNRKP